MNTKKWAIVLIIFFSLIGVSNSIFERLAQRAEKKSLKEKLLSSVMQLKNCQGKKSKLIDFLPNQYFEICFQPAYMLKQDFEKKAGRSAKSYEILQNDGEGMWWLFKKNGQTIKIELSNAEVMLSPNIEFGKCYSAENSIVSFDCDLNKQTFKVEEKK